MARTKKQKTEPLASVTAQELERGKAFALWLANAIKAAGTNAYQLSLKQDMPSSTYLYWLLDNGISNTGEYKRPSEELVRQLAEELKASEADGLKAAGYDPNTKAPYLTSGLASLPLDIQHDVASLINKLRYTSATEFEIEIAGMTSKTPTVVREPEPRFLYPSPSALVTLPIVGFAGAVGEQFNIFAEEHQEGDLTLPSTLIKNHPAEKCFIVRVRGNCLAGSMIANGDYAVCVAAETAKDGDIVLVGDGDDAVLKRYREEITDEGKFRWLETDEADGTQRVHHTEYIPRLMGRVIALHREF